MPLPSNSKLTRHFPSLCVFLADDETFTGSLGTTLVKYTTEDGELYAAEYDLHQLVMMLTPEQLASAKLTPRCDLDDLVQELVHTGDLKEDCEANA